MVVCGLIELGLPVLLHVPPRLLARLLLLHLNRVHVGQAALVGEIYVLGSCPRFFGSGEVFGGLGCMHEVPNVVEFQGSVDNGRGSNV
jgi:hypothetical protein